MQPITYERLVELGACSADRFRELFPKGSPRTLRGAIAAARRVAGQFDWDWAANHLLTVDAHVAYDAAVRSAREAYNAVERPAREAYDAALRPAREAYDAAVRPAREAYDAAVRSAREAYNAVERAAAEAYDAAKAEAFARAYFSPENRPEG